MNLLEEYIAYLKDNPQGYWFKRKLYGIGWVPARWQGWLVLGLYVAFVLGLISVMSAELADELVITHIVMPIVGATGLFLALCWRMGEPLHWRWGLDKRSKR